jgi:hypothetical protein
MRDGQTRNEKAEWDSHSYKVYLYNSCSGELFFVKSFPTLQEAEAWVEKAEKASERYASGKEWELHELMYR